MMIFSRLILGGAVAEKHKIWIGDLVALICVGMWMGNDTGCAVTKRFVNQG